MITAHRTSGVRPGARCAAALAAVAAFVAGVAGSAPQQGTPAGADPYATLAPLIGEWDVGPTGSPPAFVERFSWGPNRGYVWVSVALLRKAEPEHLHFEGLVIWNAATKRFDYLFAVEPGSLAQERGEFYVAEDGTVIREVLLTSADGGSAHFRQTFRDLGDGRFVTTLMRRTTDGWQPTFPGSDDLTMVRRPARS
jgi:hypothetical protein